MDGVWMVYGWCMDGVGEFVMVLVDMEIVVHAGGDVGIVIETKNKHNITLLVIRQHKYTPAQQTTQQKPTKNPTQQQQQTTQQQQQTTQQKPKNKQQTRDNKQTQPNNNKQPNNNNNNNEEECPRDLCGQVVLVGNQLLPPLHKPAHLLALRINL